MEYKFIIKGTLPGLNDYLKQERNFHRRGKQICSSGNEMKQEYQMIISNAARMQLKRLKIEKPVHIHYSYHEPNKKRDLDNIAGVAHKFIQDALVMCGILKNDGWNCITGFSDNFFVDSHDPRIEVIIVEEGESDG